MSQTTHTLTRQVLIGNAAPDTRGPESLTPAQHEVLALLSEECAETIQRNSKIVRWGFNADFEGTTQQYKLESELGDVLATILVAMRNGVVRAGGIVGACQEKLDKLREDAAGPRHRLRHAVVPAGHIDGHVSLSMRKSEDQPSPSIATYLEHLRKHYCLLCGDYTGGDQCCCEADE